MNATNTAHPLSDAALMRMMQHGDRIGFTLLYDRYQSRAMNVCVVVCGDANFASIAVARAFDEIWSRCNMYVPHQCAVHAWVFRIVRNTAVNVSNNTTPEPSDSGGLSVVPGEASWGLSGRDVANVFGRLLSVLPDSEREVVALAYFGELDHKEIAGILGLSAEQVEGRMRLGVDRLRSIVKTGG